MGPIDFQISQKDFQMSPIDSQMDASESDGYIFRPIWESALKLNNELLYIEGELI